MTSPNRTLKTTKDAAADFLYWNPVGGGFPHESYVIGVGFEIGGAYEDWGFGVYRVEFAGRDSKGEALYTKRLVASGRSIEEAVTKARSSEEPL